MVTHRSGEKGKGRGTKELRNGRAGDLRKYRILHFESQIQSFP